MVDRYRLLDQPAEMDPWPEGEWVQYKDIVWDLVDAKRYRWMRDNFPYLWEECGYGRDVNYWLKDAVVDDCMETE